MSLRLLILSSIVLSSALHAAPPTSRAAPEKRAAQSRDDGAVSALRKFTVAMVAGDEAALRATTLPLSASDFKMLMPQRGTRLPPEQRKYLITLMSSLAITKLKPGDMVWYRGRTRVLSEADFTANRTVLKSRAF